MNDFERMFLDVFRHRWTLDVLYALGGRPMAFTELQHFISRGPKLAHGVVLTRALRRLDAAGYVEHALDIYQLTDLGTKVRDKLDENDQWCRDTERRTPHR